MSRDQRSDQCPTSDSTLLSERQYLVRLCRQLTGEFNDAEDLAQETLLEAHRSAHRLKNQDARRAWISGIARNVCLRWRRDRARELRVAGSQDRDDSPNSELVDNFDFEIRLEHAELTSLLDRALELLPEETRHALIQRYVEEQSQARIAERLNLSRGAVAMRISRGKLALRRILATQLRDDAVALGLCPGSIKRWQPTHIWCPMCGVERLAGHFNPVKGELMLRCPDCFPAYGLHQARATGITEWSSEILGIRSAYNRLLATCHDYYSQALTNMISVCPACGALATVHRYLPENTLPRLRETRGVHTRCTNCGMAAYSSLEALILATPAARSFWQKNRRIRILPALDVESEGRPAFVSRLVSVNSSSGLDIITDAETLLLIGTYPSKP